MLVLQANFILLVQLPLRERLTLLKIPQLAQP